MARLPEPGELIFSDEVRINMGGCGATTATALARLGARTALITAVGDDVLGDFARAELARLGADTSHVVVCEGQGTSKNVVLLVKGEDRRYIYTMGATAGLRARDIAPDLVRSAKFLFVGAFLLIPNLVQDELLDVFRSARQADVRTAMDVVTARAAGFRESLDRLLPETDYFLPNQDEAEIITGTRVPRDQVSSFRDMGVGTAVVTCGPDGAVMMNDQGYFVAEPYDVPFVDGTGTGDCFNAGFISALLAGKSERDAMRWGSALGAACVSAVGGTSNLMTRAELEAFVAGRTDAGRAACWEQSRKISVYRDGLREAPRSE